MDDSDSLIGMRDSDLVSMARSLLDATVRSTKIKNFQSMDAPEQIKQAHIVLGFLKATISATNTKVAIFKMTGLKEKAKAISKHSKQL